MIGHLFKLWRMQCSKTKMKLSSGLGNLQREELWHACAGPLVSLPAIGSRVVYFPQGHIEQVAASTNEEMASFSSLPCLPSQLVCQLHDVTMHADEETDEVYAQMTLQTVRDAQREMNDWCCVPTAETGTRSKHPGNYFHKTLTASDTSTHGCCSIPRRAGEKVFPPLDFAMDRPAQELVAKDLHGNEWKFRHTFRGQPKRHLLTIGWTHFVNAKRLIAGDSVIFIWFGYGELLLGIRRANRRPRATVADGMHVGLVAAHAAATNSPFTVYYFPRRSPSEFVVPLAKYAKAVLHTMLCECMRFRMLFETPESSVRRCVGKIVGIGELDPVRWPNSHWRSVKVSWDEPVIGERKLGVSPWEIEPLTGFPIYSSPFSLGAKHPWPLTVPSHLGQREEEINSATRLMSSRNGGNPGFSRAHNTSSSVAPWTNQRLNSVQEYLPAELLQLIQQQTGTMNPQHDEDEAAAAAAAANDSPLLDAYAEYVGDCIAPQPAHDQACLTNRADRCGWVDFRCCSSSTSGDVVLLQYPSFDAAMATSFPALEMCVQRESSAGHEFIAKGCVEGLFF